MQLNKHDQEIQDKYGYGDEWAYSELINRKQDFKYIKIMRPLTAGEQRNKNIKMQPVEYMWKKHSLIEMLEVSSGKTVVGIGFNPGGNRAEFDSNEEEKYYHPNGDNYFKSGEIDQTLEKTRANTLKRVNEFLGDEDSSQIKYLLQLDLFLEPSKKSTNLDLNKAPLVKDTELLDKALAGADYALVAWGNEGNVALRKADPKLKERYVESLKKMAIEGKLLWLGKTKQNAPHHVNYAKKDSVRLISVDELTELFE